ncbi:hypothetical protein F7734_21115 [Scytonema sp. UIC 10036]|uniref:two-partner secretion domain-containing protein n=1 Tax=Scytonema sp. UIC 10036 TaxID=2304196 RepID=UPI0012DA1736|nr:hypothetical protein [Scytonema sp. UIC 10036]MUG94728.1 hypothetical protein [Scytonema sp. UIC 10036]
MSVPIGLQYGKNPESILNQSQAKNSSGEIVGLQVQPGNTLALVGGDVRLDGARLRAAGGRVELGGLAELGIVGLFVDGNNLSLSYPASVHRADVLLSNGAQVDVSASGGGSIAVNSRKIDIVGGSGLLAGVREDRGAVDNTAGDVTLNATDAIALKLSSAIQNLVNNNTKGNSGNIKIAAQSLDISDRST